MYEPRAEAPTHHYERTTAGIGPDDSLKRLAAWVPPGSEVLELGPASGYFTRQLRDVLGCTVDAIELDPTMAEQARPFCRRLVIGDLAQLDLDGILGDARYQVIVAADVIEHLAYADPVLQRLKALLAPGGMMLVSVPNVAYAGLVAALLDGHFDYRDEGLLDRSHLRFFTRDSLADLLIRSGLHPHEWTPVFRPLMQSEFKLQLERLPVALRQALLASPWALCYQWLVRVAVVPPAAPPAEPAPCRTDAFALSVLFRNVDERDDSDRRIMAWGAVGRIAQRLRVMLPEPLPRSHIRLNLAERACHLHLRSVRIVSGQDVLWHWQAGADVAALSAVHGGLSLRETSGHVRVELESSQSWLLLNMVGLPVPAGAALEIELDLPWPEEAFESAPDAMVDREAASAAVSA